MEIITNSAKETQQFAENFAKNFLTGGVIALTGSLGAGKTTFTQGFAKGLGINDKVLSPTFLIIRQYPIPGQTNFFYHIDLYRLENIDPDKIGVDFKASGLEEILSEPENIILIEWADKINEHLPKNSKKIEMKRVEENIHLIQITG